MPHQEHDQLANKKLKNIQYGFFTVEQGSSAGGYLIDGESTRNVNLYSANVDPSLNSFNPPNIIVDNISACIKEFGPLSDFDHAFVMTTSYAEGGFANIVTIDENSLQEVIDRSEAQFSTLGLNKGYLDYLTQEKISVIKADAIVFKSIPEKQILVGGASGDAHPIILIDDINKVCAYIAGSHKGLHAKVYENAVKSMIMLGAKEEDIHTIIGPGLGPNSYEFGQQAKSCDETTVTAAEYFNVAPNDETILKPVHDEKNAPKFLINLAALIRKKAQQLNLNQDHVHDMEIDTLGYDAYHPVTKEKKLNVDYEELNKAGFLFYSARRNVKFQLNDPSAENTGLHSQTGRHFAAVCFKK